ncbi:hypothetical protein [Bradyrhizobium quebecense]|uniref:Uncharacterized protein n=2 Tax=Bradyrhizobium quebecense TaxID=2748629 RepID=A0ACD3VFK0_9BRAD|nr:hypothetical protein [Bradyrhizobium quebecense]UGY05246.1 hypothetical protein J4P68_0011120 [Bradyrhizobium quebecense]
MAISRLDDFEDDTIVLHFGGAAGSIDAYTLAEALIGFADMARAISATIDPGTEIEILVEATGPGSYRTRIRRIKKDYGGLLGVGGAVFWGIVANYIYDNYVKNDPPPQVTVNADGTIVKTGKYTIDISPQVQTGTEHAKQNPAVHSGLAKTFAALEADENIKDFGITGSINDLEPKFTIPRAEFPTVAQRSLPPDEVPKSRSSKKRARLLVLKAWLNHAKRKWSFEWNGEPVSAPITDIKFLDQVDRREVLLGAGDALDAELTFRQNYDKTLGVWINDPASYVVTKVVRSVSRTP